MSYELRHGVKHSRFCIWEIAENLHLDHSVAQFLLLLTSQFQKSQDTPKLLMFNLEN